MTIKYLKQCLEYRKHLVNVVSKNRNRKKQDNKNNQWKIKDEQLRLYLKAASSQMYPMEH